jgi:hypothetical protein
MSFQKTVLLLLLFSGLFGSSAYGTCAITRGPYFQIARPKTVYVRWRTDVACDSRVRFGLTATNLNIIAEDSALTTEHVIKIGGLDQFIRFFYSVGTRTTSLASGNSYRFRTNPEDHHPGIKLRVLALGNVGTGDSNEIAVLNGYQTFTGTNQTHLMMLLGNNAYPSGTDSDYQTDLFNLYTTMLRQVSVIPTLGVIDTAGSTNPPSSLPYFNIFTLPSAAEGGGVASGTEKYFSYNDNLMHIVCLDTQSSDLSPNGPMLTWLKKDLAANTFPWLIAYFSHSPFSKGNHDSDLEQKMIDARSNILPILESYGVDLVLTGHSNSYERSYFINGFYGPSNTVKTSNFILKRDGREGSTGGQGVYHKPAGAKNAGAVYAVVGSSGKAVSGPLNHPAMFLSMAKLGSFMFDLYNNRLDAKFVLSNGSIGDYFTIVKDNQKPSITLTSPLNGATYSAPASIFFSANASDIDTHLDRVAFFANSKRLFIDFSSPYNFNWTNVPAGTYSIYAETRDDLGATTRTPTISVVVK